MTTDTRMDERLLPCPFCGAQADPPELYGESKTAMFIDCSGCGASVYHGTADKETNRAAVIKAWNRRTQSEGAVRTEGVETELAKARERFTMHTAQVHAWLSALATEFGIAGVGDTLDVATACSKIMDAAQELRRAASDVAIGKVFDICTRIAWDFKDIPELELPTYPVSFVEGVKTGAVNIAHRIAAVAASPESVSTKCTQIMDRDESYFPKIVLSDQWPEKLSSSTSLPQHAQSGVAFQLQDGAAELSSLAHELSRDAYKTSKSRAMLGERLLAIAHRNRIALATPSTPACLVQEGSK